MARRCDITGRGPQVGNKVSHANKKSKRKFNINLQKVRALVDGRVVTMKVSTKAIKSGLIEKPPIKIRQRKPKVLKPQVVAQAPTMIEEMEGQFFSTSSVVTRLFKPKQTIVEDIEDFEDMLDSGDLEEIEPQSSAEISDESPAETSEDTPTKTSE